MWQRKTIFFLMLIMCIPAYASASAVWQDTANTGAVYTGSDACDYSIDADVLSPLSAGTSTFTMDDSTLGTWGNHGDSDDFLVAVAHVEGSKHRDVMHAITGANNYNLSLDFPVKKDIHTCTTYGPMLNFLSFIDVYSVVTGSDEKWQLNNALITSSTTVPGAAILLGSGLLSLFGLRRKSAL
jgi:hypothetical protein